MIFLQSSIGKFGSSLARPVSWRGGKINFVAPSRNIIYFINFFYLSAISLLLEAAGNTNAHVWRSIKHASIVFQNWSLLGTPIKVYEFVLPCICWHDFAGLILMFKECFVLDNLFVTFRVPGMSWYRFCLRVDQIRSAKSCSYLVSFV